MLSCERRLRYRFEKGPDEGLPEERWYQIVQNRKRNYLFSLPLGPKTDQIMAVKFRDWLDGMKVNLKLTGRSQDDALREASDLLCDHPAMIDNDKFRADVIARERLSSTASGLGLAFPHARTDAVSDIVIAAARSQEGVRFEGQEEPVYLLFVMGTPKDRIPDHLACVASLARALRQKELRQKLLSAETAEEFIANLQAAF